MEISKDILNNFVLPTKRDKSSGLLVVKDKQGNIVFKCKSKTKLASWLVDLEQAISIKKKMQGESFDG